MGIQTSGNSRSSTRAARPKRTARTRTGTPIDQDLRRALIAKAAYYRAENRGFAAGQEAEDWLAAEREVDTALTMGAMPSSD